MPKESKNWYFTFCIGSQHQHSGGCYTIIDAPDYGTARERMVSKFGLDWAFQYESAEDAGVKEFNLKFIDAYGKDES